MIVAKALLRGVAAGAAGTAVMTAAQLAYAKATGTGSSSTPAEVGRRVIGGVLRREVPEDEEVLNNAMHWVYGTSWGALLGLAAAGREPGRGVVFGLTVWGASLVHLPAMRLAPPVWEYDPKTLASDVGFHVVYGVATAGAYRALA
jgi:hypothetical protein